MKTAPYGTWSSPIGAADVARADGAPGWVAVAGDEIWWDEPRPLQGGRRCVVRALPDGATRDALPPGSNARNRVHEYGGRAWRPVPRGDGKGARLVFTEWADQRLYLHDPDGTAAPRPLTPAPERPAGLRYADLVVVADRDEVWCVRETVTGDRPGDVLRDIVAVPLDGTAAHDRDAVRPVVRAQRFVVGPRPSPDGRHLAWIGWDHPHMPWDQAELWVAPLRADGTAGPGRRLAGGDGEAVAQAEWRDATTLYAATDPDGWWNLYAIPLDGGPSGNLAARPEEFGGPLWKPGLVWFHVLADGRLLTLHGTGDDRRLGVLDPDGGDIADLPVPAGTVWQPTLDAHGLLAAGVAGAPDRPWEVVRIDLATADVTPPRPPRGDRPRRADRPGEGDRPREADPPHRAWLPRPYAASYPGPSGPVHAHVYPPHSPDHRGPSDTPPPYLVFAHGGPTGGVQMAHDLEVAYFTSRGIGVVEVNYGGSVGYGRAYRERLRENWGVVDVADCAAVARGLAADGLADPDRLAIRGGSAGGWTALASLTSTDAYRGAVSYYGITDPRAWARGTHDFESHYLDGLIGPLPGAEPRYRERSWVARADRASGPALLLHGLDDVIVEPEQSARFAAALRRAGGRCAYLTFPGETHGFRRAETVAAALEAELAFYAEIFGFRAPGVRPIDLPAGAGGAVPTA
ncbi:S9 family peptidase [Allostreptomyces psammosilenae]|uniref:Dipeptidyl aminopeptidase/acylaminoacyl peptidase n=1 Tax=Allostreptomyces psammosilenae TaxID=1892865 RepID=A0A852ZQX1_9ACTN|nr:prolyl oligopeptidase family serine peptidase [Allostreptomyces psammosilenae]NYI04779.1 dipeptidyl aminopeptidase/acylaminoacyl peptidase [Allostreptomyces psammosilenae]